MANTILLAALAPVGRLLLAFIFIVSGAMKIADIPGTMGYIASGGLPGVLVYPTILLELGGGLALALGWQARWMALALAGFALATGVLYHLIPAGAAEPMMAQLQTVMFLKNVSMAGGLLMVTALGAGGWSLDARRQARVTPAG